MTLTLVAMIWVTAWVPVLAPVAAWKWGDRGDRFDAVDAAVAQLKSEGFINDGQNPFYPWTSRDGLASARVVGERGRYKIEVVA